MVLHRRIRFLLAAAALVTAFFVAAHVMSSPPTPGRSLTWADATQSSASASPAPLAGVPVLPSATPRPSRDAGPLGALQAPLTTILQQLNGDTKNTAQGEYSILQELERGLRDRVEQFLAWLTGRR